MIMACSNLFFGRSLSAGYDGFLAISSLLHLFSWSGKERKGANFEAYRGVLWLFLTYRYHLFTDLAFGIGNVM